MAVPDWRNVAIYEISHQQADLENAQTDAENMSFCDEEVVHKIRVQVAVRNKQQSSIKNTQQSTMFFATDMSIHKAHIFSDSAWDLVHVETRTMPPTNLVVPLVAIGKNTLCTALCSCGAGE
eukprot:2366514-Ditylum_brightwellii.AAC.1